MRFHKNINTYNKQYKLLKHSIIMEARSDDKKAMLESVRAYLSEFSHDNEKINSIIDAMDKIDRKNFINDEYKKYAYLDQAIPSEKTQTISQPSTVARMLLLLNLNQKDNVLEIGAGTGWSCALIGFIVKHGYVKGLEIVDKLREKAIERINKQGLNNVEIKRDDFRNLNDTYDKIVFTAGINMSQEKFIEEFAKEHLKENGRLICPFQFGPMLIFDKTQERLEKTTTQEHYAFVPLVLD